MTDHYQTQCFSTHLTTFASAYSNAPSIAIPKSSIISDIKQDVVFDYCSSCYPQDINYDTLNLVILK